MTDIATIFAPASAIGKAGVSVFRISGLNASAVVTHLCNPNEIPQPRLASLREIRNARGEIVDRALVLFFKAPHSFTGDDVVELHTHGGRAVMQAVMETLQTLPHYRLAEPGEFTRRAFENGKMDLTEAEAVADLVHAETEAQRKQALRQMDGALGRLYEEWRTALSRGLAYMEAAIDFSDEELPEDMVEKQSAELKKLRDLIAAHLNDNHRGERLRDGFSIAILGPPNAGKSSLLNALARREAAIVSSIPGTTRDVIEVHMDIGGFPVTLADTAGLRDLPSQGSGTTSHDLIENEGIRRARARAEQADLKVLVFDGAAWPQRDAATESLITQDALIVVNKSDLVKQQDQDTIFISAQNGGGIDTLLQKLRGEIEKRFHDTGTPPLTRARHRAALEECVTHLDRALAALMADQRAEDVRLAMRALGRITGRVDVEDLLDIIFRDFCIGK
jgi:tRNA modification GTPase